MKKNIHTPHDKMFRASMQYPEVAYEFLKMHLPESILKKLDMSSISVCPNSFIDEELRLLQSDVLLKALVEGKDTYFYILAEHQKNPDPLMPFRLIEYMVKIWSYILKQSRQNKKKSKIVFPVIVPLVFYTGIRRYNAPMAIWELFGDQSETMRHIWQSPYLLVDANTIPEEQLISNKWSGTMEFIMRNRFKQHWDHEIQKIAGNLSYLLHEKDRQLVVELLLYIVGISGEHCTLQELTSAIHELAPDVEEEIMNLAEKLREEGEIKGKLEIARNMLADGVEPVFVAKYTGLSLQQVKKCKESNEE